MPAYLKDLEIPADNLKVSTLEAGLVNHLKQYFQDKPVIEEMSGDQVF